MHDAPTTGHEGEAPTRQAGCLEGTRGRPVREQLQGAPACQA